MYQGTLDPVSNQADWKPLFEVVDDDTGEDIDISTATVVFEVREQPDSSTSSGAVLSATIANGKVTLVDTGVFQVWFTRTDMRTLCSGNYDVGCIITNNSETSQFIIGTLPVLDGVVT